MANDALPREGTCRENQHDDAIPHEIEELQLIYGCELIIACSRALRLPQPVAATGCVLFHRFFLDVSLRTHSHVWAASGALLLATKIEEQVRKIRDIANVLHAQLCVREGLGELAKDGQRVPLDFYGAFGYEWKRNIVQSELRILHELGFNVRVEHAHKFVLVFVNTLREKAHAGDWLNGGHTWRDVLQSAWKYANGALRLRLCVLEKAEDIACACIALGAAEVKVDLPEGWNDVFGSSAQNMKRIEAEIRRLYTLSPAAGRFVDLADSGVLEMCSANRDADISE